MALHVLRDALVNHDGHSALQSGRLEGQVFHFVSELLICDGAFACLFLVFLDGSVLLFLFKVPVAGRVENNVVLQPTSIVLMCVCVLFLDNASFLHKRNVPPMFEHSTLNHKKGVATAVDIDGDNVEHRPTNSNGDDGFSGVIVDVYCVFIVAFHSGE